jgi:uncharacterized protein
VWMLLGSAPLSLVGVQIASTFSSSTTGSMAKVVGATLILGGIGFLAKTFVSGRTEDRPFHLGTRDKVLAVIIGATFGFVVGLTSVGSGTFFGLAMLLVYPLTARRIVGTDMLHAAALLWVAGAGHLLHGNVDLHAIAWLLIGSIPGVLIGSNLSVKVPERALRVAFAFVLVLSGVKLVEFPAATTIIEVGIGFAVLVFAVWSFIGLRNRRVPAADAA